MTSHLFSLRTKGTTLPFYEGLGTLPGFGKLRPGSPAPLLRLSHDPPSVYVYFVTALSVMPSRQAIHGKTGRR
jgi:hypothetical protein